MASSGGKAPYQYHTNASSMNGNNRVAILHHPSQMDHSGSAHHHHHSVEDIEDIENEESVAIASEEKKFDPMIINVSLADCEKPASKNKTAMCLINELVRSNKVLCNAAISR